MRKMLLLVLGALILLNLVIADTNTNYIAGDEEPGPRCMIFRI